MAGGGGDVVVPVSPRGVEQPSRGGRRGHRQKAAWLPLDVIVEIAALSDPATLVRCAATCRDARRRIAEDPSLLGRLRLRATERFVLPLLRGHLTGITTYTGRREKTNVYMVDTTAAADATRLVKATFGKADETQQREVVPVDSRGGLVLLSATTMAQDNFTLLQQQRLVCNPATRRCQALPPKPAFPAAVPSTEVQYVSFLDGVLDGVRSTSLRSVLLVGGSDGDGGAGADAAVGRPFQVLRAKLVLSAKYRCYRRLLVQTFSSEHGAWSPCTEIPTPNLLGTNSSLSRPLVVGDVVHWLCLTDAGSYMLMLHVGAARLSVTSLPESFPRDGRNTQYDLRRRYLLATASAGGNPIVLVADTDRISAWEQSKHTKMWKPRPQVVIENETIFGFKDDGPAELVAEEWRWRTISRKQVANLLFFGERSGAVLLRTHGCCLLWLDLHSKKIVRCFASDRWMSQAQVYCPYEVDLSTWVPTFSSAVTL